MTKLVCIDTKPAEADTGLDIGLVLGGEYELLGTHKCSVTKFDVGILHPSATHYRALMCANCNQKFPNKNTHYYAWRFIKLDPDFKLETTDREAETAS